MTPAENTHIDQRTDSICSCPEDVARMLVLAKYFDDRGDTRGAYLREQVVLRNSARDSKDRESLLCQLRLIYPAAFPTWLAKLEQAGAIEANLTEFPATWWGQELPGRASEATYTQYSGLTLPALPVARFDSSLGWLTETERCAGDSASFCSAQPWQQLLGELEEQGFMIPPALSVLMNSRALQESIPSCTANYFISAEPADEQIDASSLQQMGEGVVFLPFYSDQQMCVRWGVRLSKKSKYAPVLCASVDWNDEDELQYTYLEFAAPTVENFLYRTWIENRIWYATLYEETLRDLFDFEVTYLEQLSIITTET